jgi:hypothetical protein
MFLYRDLFICWILLLTKKMNSKSIIAEKIVVPILVVFICDLIFWEKYMLYMFCVELLMSSSSAIYCLDLLFLIERKIWIKHGYDDFYIVIIYCVYCWKVLKSVVWHFL